MRFADLHKQLEIFPVVRNGKKEKERSLYQAQFQR